MELEERIVSYEKDCIEKNTKILELENTKLCQEEKNKNFKNKNIELENIKSC